jgi:hypothetical protein
VYFSYGKCQTKEKSRAKYLTDSREWANTRPLL